MIDEELSAIVTRMSPIDGNSFVWEPVSSKQIADNETD